LILAPTAGAAAAQSASAQEFRVQTSKALAAPAQDFRVSYGSTTQATIFAKFNLPKAPSDAELDEVKGEFVMFLPAAPAAAGAISAGAVEAGAAAVAAGAVVGEWLGDVYDAAKKSKQSGKEAAIDIPSWSKGMTGEGSTPAQRAEDIMDQRYGEGNWGEGNTSREYNQIKKNQQRQNKK